MQQNNFTEVPSDYFDGAGELHAIIHTNMGVIDVKLFEHESPKTVANFIGLALGKRTWQDLTTFEERNDPFYDGVIFHRVIPGFMIQGGDRQGTGRGGPGYRFEDELPKPGQYELGSVAMANAGPNTNGSQFFVISGKAGMGLPPQYSLFGKVIKGLEVVEAIQNVPTGGGDRPKTDVVIESVTVTEHAD